MFQTQNRYLILTHTGILQQQYSNYDALACFRPKKNPRVFSWIVANVCKCEVSEVGKKIFDDKKVTDHFAIVPTRKGLQQVPAISSLHCFTCPTCSWC